MSAQHSVCIYLSTLVDQPIGRPTDRCVQFCSEHCVMGSSRWKRKKKTSIFRNRRKWPVLQMDVVEENWKLKRFIEWNRIYSYSGTGDGHSSRYTRVQKHCVCDVRTDYRTSNVSAANRSAAGGQYHISRSSTFSHFEMRCT